MIPSTSVFPGFLFPSTIWAKNLYSFTFSPMRPKLLANLILFHFITLMTFVGEHKWSFSLHNFLHPALFNMYDQVTIFRQACKQHLYLPKFPFRFIFVGNTVHRRLNGNYPWIHLWTQLAELVTLATLCGNETDVTTWPSAGAPRKITGYKQSDNCFIYQNKPSIHNILYPISCA